MSRQVGQRSQARLALYRRGHNLSLPLSHEPAHGGVFASVRIQLLLNQPLNDLRTRSRMPPLDSSLVRKQRRAVRPCRTILFRGAISPALEHRSWLVGKPEITPPCYPMTFAAVPQRRKKVHRSCVGAPKLNH